MVSGALAGKNREFWTSPGKSVKFQVLGPIGIATQDGLQVAPKALKLRSLLAYLCAHREEVVSVSRLTEVLWSGAPPRTAPTALHVYISKLRQYLQSLGLDATSLIVTQPPGYRINLSGHVLDLDQFEVLLARAGRLRSSLESLEEASEVLDSAIALWRGRALEDLRTVPAFDSLGQRLDERRAFAHTQRLEIELELGNHKAVISEISSLIDERPTWENLYGYLMVALYRSGRTAEALAAYGRIRQVLVQDLGIEPGPQLKRLQQSILTHDPALTW
ncbi:AfsR/SARP family transcriptional regulator [Streptomyces sp. NBC_01275]|uniref:AfsR/SARP family transcriptional regulator n=1 Tax=Streptomyces sp. NBC_01275 TaxID=2903807 RepID=UPI00224EB859|nr:AfsR/SARP family transcriptional regulator [Streptomyces sp. NBC_01275]MCX4763957.1 AfsR/SARP family transcriptional regulator [Streptomyces sp. NBC_01275]